MEGTQLLTEAFPRTWVGQGEGRQSERYVDTGHWTLDTGYWILDIPAGLIPIC